MKQAVQTMIDQYQNKTEKISPSKREETENKLNIMINQLSMLENGHKNLNNTLKSVQTKRAEIQQRLKNKQRRISSSSSSSFSTSYELRVIKLKDSIADVEKTLFQVRQLMNKQKKKTLPRK